MWWLVVLGAVSLVAVAFGVAVVSGLLDRADFHRRRAQIFRSGHACALELIAKLEDRRNLTYRGIAELEEHEQGQIWAGCVNGREVEFTIGLTKYDMALRHDTDLLPEGVSIFGVPTQEANDSLPHFEVGPFTYECRVEESTAPDPEIPQRLKDFFREEPLEGKYLTHEWVGTTFAFPVLDLHINNPDTDRSELDPASFASKYAEDADRHLEELEAFADKLEAASMDE